MVNQVKGSTFECTSPEHLSWLERLFKFHNCKRHVRPLERRRYRAKGECAICGTRMIFLPGAATWLDSYPDEWVPATALDLALDL